MAGEESGGAMVYDAWQVVEWRGRPETVVYERGVNTLDP
jgi:hypothetical protein